VNFTPATPLGYLRTFGPRADPATDLTWGLIVISLAVVIVVTVLVVAGVLVRRSRGSERPPVAESRHEARWIWVGLAPTCVVLLLSLVWTVEVLARINDPPRRPALTVEITGHQWWWEARYDFAQPNGTLVTANEIHIPVGTPVLVKLTSADVIHSFWIPALTGKTDTIPGRTNLTWIEASRPGDYRGQCTEYCGAQHAGMAAFVIAEPPAAFAAWRAAQSAPARAPSGPAALAGQAVFAAYCAACHTVRGTGAEGILGPDLTHIASRQSLASGLIPNSPGSLAGWIGDPQALKPGARMPAVGLSGPQLGAVVAYLEGLK
jgi:cytochrome c oxidase subunit 2